MFCDAAGQGFKGEFRVLEVEYRWVGGNLISYEIRFGGADLSINRYEDCVLVADNNGWFEGRSEIVQNLHSSE